MEYPVTSQKMTLNIFRSLFCTICTHDDELPRNMHAKRFSRARKQLQFYKKKKTKI